MNEGTTNEREQVKNDKMEEGMTQRRKGKGWRKTDGELNYETKEGRKEGRNKQKNKEWTIGRKIEG